MNEVIIASLSWFFECSDPLGVKVYLLKRLPCNPTETHCIIAVSIAQEYSVIVFIYDLFLLKSVKSHESKAFTSFRYQSLIFVAVEHLNRADFKRAHDLLVLLTIKLDTMNVKNILTIYFQNSLYDDLALVWRLAHTPG